MKSRSKLDISGGGGGYAAIRDMSGVKHNDFAEIFDGRGLGVSGPGKRAGDSDEDYSSYGSSSEEEEDEKLEARVKEVNA